MSHDPISRPNLANLDLTAELRKWFGFPGFRPGQEKIIRQALAGQDLLVVMPTGSGKSLCYQLPGLLLPDLTVVISPLIALMKDQVDALAARTPHGGTFINSSIPVEEQAARLRAALAGQYKLLYVAPERFRVASFTRALTRGKVSLFVVDEAHCISEWGHDFRPDYLYLKEVIPRLGHPPVLALTATATKEVQADILRQLGRPQMERVITGFNRPNLSFEVQYAADEKDKLRRLKELLEEINGCGIIYAGTRRETEEVADFAAAVGGRRADFYHAGLPAEQRTRVQEAFMGGDLDLVVATNAFGMGVDKPDLRFVIHYDLPGTVEAYYQEAGRAGRDGAFSRCVLLYSPPDRALQEWLIDNDAPTPEELQKLFQQIRRACVGQTALIEAETLEQVTGLRDVQIRVGLRQLEEMGLLTRLGDLPEGMTLELRQLEISSAAARENEELTRRRRHIKRVKLQAMVRYAETNECRRKFILNYFGDPGEPSADALCCDNHAAPAVTPEETTPEATAVAHTILRAVTQPRYGLGRERLAEVLRGSQSKKIGADLRRLEVYGALDRFTLDHLRQLIDRLIADGYLKLVGSEYPVLALTPQGKQTLAQQWPVALDLSAPATPARSARPFLPGSTDLPDTVAETLRLLRAGQAPAEIARARGLAEGTVWHHLATLIGRGLVRAEEIVAPDRQRAIEAVIQRLGLSPLKAIRDELGPDFSYHEIRCVCEDVRRRQQGEPEPTPPPAAEPLATRHPPEDEVGTFLASDRPKRLYGAWDVGWALAFNARFWGDQWRRTETGEQVYRLKYRGHREVADPLGQKMAELLERMPELSRCEFMVPIPPSSRSREFDPVTELVLAVSRHSGMPVSLGLLTRTRDAPPQKDMASEGQKQANVRGLFAVAHADRLAGRRVLLVDDFFDSGATLNEAARTLKAHGAAAVCVLTAAKTIHHG